MKSYPSKEDIELLGNKEILLLLKISKSTLERMLRGESSLQFPAPDLYFSRSPRWRVTTIAKWIEENSKSL